MVSSFSGCGGSCLGFKAAGFNVLSAIEFIPEAASTYRANFPETFVYEADIRDIQGRDILSRFHLNQGDLDIFEGSPPCSDFSTQRISTSGLDRGKFKHYSQTMQRVDDLFLEYARILGELSPKVFIAENVSNLVNIEEYFKTFLTVLTGAGPTGYKVGYHVYDFANFGVPQSRKRVIIMGVRKDLNIEPSFPEANHRIITTREAIEDLVDSVPDLKMTDLEQKYCRLIPKGAGIDYISELRDKYGLKIMIFNHRRDTWEIPHPTLVHNTRHIHPLKNRWLTVQEAKRLCSFPDDFILTGPSSKQWERLGRAVPPQAYLCIAEHIRDNILNPIKESVQNS
jgi:DNA (cytosine-5)-methyltransferase 1